MKLNRRLFFGSLLAAPVAVAAAKQLPARAEENVEWPSIGYVCFNCREVTPPSRWLPQGVPTDRFHEDAKSIGVYYDSEGKLQSSVVLHLCDACLESIRFCAVCEEALGEGEGHLRESLSGEMIAPFAWPEKMFPGLAMYVDSTTFKPLSHPFSPRYRIAQGSSSIDLTSQAFTDIYGFRPVDRSLIVADCDSCFSRKTIR